jgi:glutamine synthetase
MSELQSILSRWQTEGIRWVRFEAPDLMGASRSKLVPIEAASGFAEDGLNMYGGALVLDSRSDVVPGGRYHDEISFTDHLLHPDPSTAAIVPWADRTARFICHSRWYDGSAQQAAPRMVLQRVLEQLAELGYANFGAQENEFYVLDPATKQPALFGGSMIFNTQRNEYHPLVREVLELLTPMGLDFITANCEYGPTQWEINYGPAHGMKAADDTFTFRTGVKEIAQRHGLLATFISKPSATMSGSGAHLHVSLLDTRSGKNAFADARSASGLSTLALQFIAGNIHHAAAVYAFAAPTVNCLKRRRPHTFSPTTVSWGVEDRTALVRVKQGSLASRHLEYRAPSALSNPYLVLAGVLAAGLAGIRSKGKPPKPTEFGRTAEDDPRWAQLPSTLRDSLQALDDDRTMRSILGDEFVDIFLTVKRYELSRFEDHVTDWEINEYAELY